MHVCDSANHIFLSHKKWKRRMFEQTSAGFRGYRKRSRQIARNANNTRSDLIVFKYTIRVCSLLSHLPAYEHIPIWRDIHVFRLILFQHVCVCVPLWRRKKCLRKFVFFQTLDSPAQTRFAIAIANVRTLLRLRCMLMQWSTRFWYRKLQMSRCNWQMFVIINDDGGGGGGGHTRRCAIFPNSKVCKLNVVTMAMTYLGNGVCQSTILRCRKYLRLILSVLQSSWMSSRTITNRSAANRSFSIAHINLTPCV